MAKQGSFRRIITFVFSGIALLAAVGGIGTLGWYAAVAYYGLRNEVSDLRVAKLAEQQKATIQELSTSLAQLNNSLSQKDKEKESLIASHKSEIEKTKKDVADAMKAEFTQRASDIAPNDKDWMLLNVTCIEMYSNLVSSQCALEQGWTQPDEFVKRFFELTRMLGQAERARNLTEQMESLNKMMLGLKDILEPIVRGAQNALGVHAMLSKYNDKVSSQLMGAGLTRTRVESDGAYFTLKKFPYFGVNVKTGEMRELYSDLATMPSP